MKLSTLYSLPFTAPSWSEVERANPRLAVFYASIVLPLSLLPPAMLYLEGATFFSPWLANAATRDWGTLAIDFFITEVICLALMGWFIRKMADAEDFRMNNHDAYLLAGVAPIPLWLSSLGMLVPSLALNVVISLIAFGLSCGIIYHGVSGFTHNQENVRAAGVAHTVMSAGLLAWVLLLVMIVL